MRGEGVNWGEAGRREKGEGRREKGEGRRGEGRREKGDGNTLRNFNKVLLKQALAQIVAATTHQTTLFRLNTRGNYVIFF